MHKKHEILWVACMYNSANLGLVENFNCYFFTTKEGFQQNYGPKWL